MSTPGDAASPLDVAGSVDRFEGDALRGGRPQVRPSDGPGAVLGLRIQNRQNPAQDPPSSVHGFGPRSTFGLRRFVDGFPATLPDGRGVAR